MLRCEAMREPRLLRSEEARRRAEVRDAADEHELEDLVRDSNAANRAVRDKAGVVHRFPRFRLLSQEGDDRLREVGGHSARLEHAVKEGR